MRCRGCQLLTIRFNHVHTQDKLMHRKVKLCVQDINNIFNRLKFCDIDLTYDGLTARTTCSKRRTNRSHSYLNYDRNKRKNVSETKSTKPGTISVDTVGTTLQAWITSFQNSNQGLPIAATYFPAAAPVIQTKHQVQWKNGTDNKISFPKQS